MVKRICKRFFDPQQCSSMVQVHKILVQVTSIILTYSHILVEYRKHCTSGCMFEVRRKITKESVFYYVRKNIIYSKLSCQFFMSRSTYAGACKYFECVSRLLLFWVHRELNSGPLVTFSNYTAYTEVVRMVKGCQYCCPEDLAYPPT